MLNNGREITENEFIGKFKKMDRNNFSENALKCLFNYLIFSEKESGIIFELDVIELCEGYREYKNLDEFWKDYDFTFYSDFQIIKEFTNVIKINDKSFIIKKF